MGSGGVAIAALPTVICLKVSFSDGLGGYYVNEVVVNPIAVKKYDGKPFFVKLK